MSKIMLVSAGGMDPDVMTYGVTTIEHLDYPVFREWEQIDENVWCEENDVIVIGDSEEECLKKLKEIDSDGEEWYVYVKDEHNRAGEWVLKLESMYS